MSAGSGETSVTIDGVGQHDKAIPFVDDRQEHSVCIKTQGHFPYYPTEKYAEKRTIAPSPLFSKTTRHRLKTRRAFRRNKKTRSPLPAKAERSGRTEKIASAKGV